MRTVARHALYLLCGTLFGLGLAISDMVNPQKVLNFLDLAGTWDPSLALVMGSGLAVMSAAWLVVGRRDRPFFEDAFQLPTRQDLDSRLVGGAILFGVGWGLIGLCPGPALANLGREGSGLYSFVASMSFSIVLYRALQHGSPKR